MELFFNDIKMKNNLATFFIVPTIAHLIHFESTKISC